MSNLIPIDAQIPAHLANRVGQPSALADSLGGGITGGAEYPRISLKGSRFRIVDDGTETVLDAPKLDVVIIGANSRLSKTWYEAAYNPDAESKGPDCYSLDGLTPDPDSDKPQNDLCASCPQNAWGSRVTQQGTKIKACSDAKRLAVVSADAADGPMYLLTVTPAALKGLHQFQKELTMRGINPDIVRTQISFDTTASFPKLAFGYGGFLDPETQAKVDARFGTDIIADITGDNGLAAPALPPAAAPAGLAPPTPEPTPAPVAGFGAPTLVPDPAPTAADVPPPAAPATSVAGFGGGAATAPTEAAPVAGFGAPAAPVEAQPEPVAAPVVDSVTAGLAAEISQLLEQVSDDAK